MRHMADAAALKDLAWGDQWAVGGGRTGSLPPLGCLAAPAQTSPSPVARL